MDTRCLDYMLRDAERQSFERDGYLIVENALTPAQVELALAATDRLADEARVKKNLGPRDRVAVHNFAGRDEAFLELVDLPQTFARVWGLLGWNIQLYHSHLNITPPEGPDKGTRTELAPGQRPAQPGAGDESATACLAQGRLLPDGLHAAGTRQLPGLAGQPSAERDGLPRRQPQM